MKHIALLLLSLIAILIWFIYALSAMEADIKKSLELMRRCRAEVLRRRREIYRGSVLQFFSFLLFRVNAYRFLLAACLFMIKNFRALNLM
jgi:hypothetical protein